MLYRRVLPILVVLAAALLAAFVVAPGPLAASASGSGFADSRHLTDALREAFVGYWRSGNERFSPDLQRVVDYWFCYHAAKAVIAALLLAVLVALAVRLGQALLRTSGPETGTRVAHASGGVLVTMLAVLSLATVMANVQGAVAPFASLLPMLPDGPADGELADTLAQVRQQLADTQHTGGQTPPALQVMIDDFSRYHMAMVVIAAIAAAVLIGTSVLLWRRSGRLSRSYAVLSALLGLAAIVVAAANATTAADPAPALAAFFDGGW